MLSVRNRCKVGGLVFPLFQTSRGAAKCGGNREWGREFLLSFF